MLEGNSAEWLGAWATVIGLILVLCQIKKGNKVSKGQFLLNLDAEFRHHNEIYYRLLGQDQWDELKDPHKRAKLISYLGLFERIYSLVQDGILSIGQVQRLYGYRLDGLLTNEAVHQMIIDDSFQWSDLIFLLKALNTYKKLKGLDVDTALSSRIDELPCFKSDWRDMVD